MPDTIASFTTGVLTWLPNNRSEHTPPAFQKHCAGTRSDSVVGIIPNIHVFRGQNVPFFNV